MLSDIHWLEDILKVDWRASLFRVELQTAFYVHEGKCLTHWSFGISDKWSEQLFGHATRDPIFAQHCLVDKLQAPMHGTLLNIRFVQACSKMLVQPALQEWSYPARFLVTLAKLYLRLKWTVCLLFVCFFLSTLINFIRINQSESNLSFIQTKNAHKNETVYELYSSCCNCFREFYTIWKSRVHCDPWLIKLTKSSRIELIYF